MQTRKLPHLSRRLASLKREQWLRINDLTVPYVTAAIEAEDPFLNHATNGIDMYGILGYRAGTLN
jgi:hypothetical protein